MKYYIAQSKRGYIKRDGEKLLTSDFALDALEIEVDTYRRRYSKYAGFTRDELMCIAIYSKFNKNETNRLIELCNNAFGKNYPFLNPNDKRDQLFIELIGTKYSYTFNEIDDKLSEYDLEGLSSLDPKRRL